MDRPSSAADAVPGLDDAGWQRLCDEIRSGDEGAFAHFYDLWFARALQLARAVVRDEDAGLDVVQDVMLKVVHKLPPLSGERAVTAWMARTLSAAAIDRCRSEQRRRRREQHAARDDMIAGDRLAELGDHEQLRWLRTQLAGLSTDERLLLQQRFGGETSLSAVATALGLSTDAVHSRVRRLVLRLRNAAKEWFDDA